MRFLRWKIDDVFLKVENMFLKLQIMDWDLIAANWAIVILKIYFGTYMDQGVIAVDPMFRNLCLKFIYQNLLEFMIWNL